MTTRHKRAAQSGKSNTPATLFDHRFKRPDLLTWALTHRSLASETNPESLPDPTADNEQLEFVGDAVLGLIVAEALFRSFPGSREGELTRLRSSIVSRRHLGEVGENLPVSVMVAQRFDGLDEVFLMIRRRSRPIFSISHGLFFKLWLQSGI